MENNEKWKRDDRHFRLMRIGWSAVTLSLLVMTVVILLIQKLPRWNTGYSLLIAVSLFCVQFFWGMDLIRLLQLRRDNLHVRLINTRTVMFTLFLVIISIFLIPWLVKLLTGQMSQPVYERIL